MRKMGILFLICMWIVSGCSLAIPDAGEENTKPQDRLIGAFITTEHLDLFDMEAYLNDHVEDFIGADGSEKVVVDSGDYNERLYAVVDKHNSASPKDWEISFGEIEGICFFDATFQNEEEPFTMIVGGDEICDVASGLSVGDNEESVSLTGTLYALIGEYENVQFYINPVYQTTDGEIYTVTGNGYSMSGELGGSSKVKLEESFTTTKDGVEQTYSGAVEIAFEIRNAAPVNICLQFMNEDLEIVQTKEYAAGEMPTQVELAETAVCIIVETQWADGTVTRELVEWNEDERVSIETFYSVGDSVLGKQMTEIVLKITSEIEDL